jgi:hypothetical protein
MMKGQTGAIARIPEQIAARSPVCAGPLEATCLFGTGFLTSMPTFYSIEV